MAEISQCVVCKSELPPGENFTQISADEGTLDIYKRRLETALGLTVTTEALSDKRICCRCEDRLAKIEELRKVQEAFRDDFMGSLVPGDSKCVVSKCSHTFFFLLRCISWSRNDFVMHGLL